LLSYFVESKYFGSASGLSYITSFLLGKISLILFHSTYFPFIEKDPLLFLGLGGNIDEKTGRKISS